MKIVRGFHSNVEKEWALRNRVQVGIFFHMVMLARRVVPVRYLRPLRRPSEQ